MDITWRQKKPTRSEKVKRQLREYLYFIARKVRSGVQRKARENERVGWQTWCWPRSLWNGYHMVPKETYAEWEGQAAVTGILIFHCTESSLWRPAQNTWEGKNRLTNMVLAKIIMKWISHGAKRNLLGVRRSSGSNGNTYISLHGKFALASSAKHVRTKE